MDLLVSLDSQSEAPLQRQLYESLREAIISGRLPRGQKLPATREFAKSLGISRTTVTLAYESLTTEGYIEGLTGSGTFVATQLPDDLMRPALRKAGAKVADCATPKPRKLSRFGNYVRNRDFIGPVREPEIQMAVGRPDLEHFPMRQWLQLLNHHAKNKDFSALELPNQSKGYQPLRQAIAAYLARARALKADPDQIIIVNGSQQAIDLIARVFIEHGDAVGMENPCFYGAKAIFEAAYARIIPVGVDDHGVIVDQLKSELTPNLKLMYVTPSHQFPTGVALSLPRRLELLSWANCNGSMIIEDDYDSEFRYCGRPVPALAGLDQNESVIYVGTFSKTLFVSLRLGYLLVPKPLAKTFAHAKWLTDRHTPILEQQVLADFISSGQFERHIRRMRAIYAGKRETILHELQSVFGNRCEVTGDAAGINLLAKFKTRLTNEEIVEQAMNAGVSVIHAVYLDEPRHGELVMCYGGLSESDIKKGVRLLAEVIST